MGVPGLAVQPVDEGNLELAVRFLGEWVSDGEAEAREFLADHDLIIWLTKDLGGRGILAVMPELIKEPTRVAAAGQPPKLIDEYVGRANTGQGSLSIAHMRSPSGWAEPGQRPEFDEFTIVLRGALVVESEGAQMTVQPGQGVHTRPGEWVRYSTPGADGAEYISVCVPAFAPDTVHRDE